MNNIDSFKLTVRQKKVTALVAEGHMNKEIASRLGTTEDAIKNSLRLVFDKTGNWSRLELALWQLTRENER